MGKLTSGDMQKKIKAMNGEEAYNEFLTMLNETPAVEVEPVRHGRWIDKQEDDLTEGMWRCSACGEDFYFLEDNPSEYGTNYCVNCGARMDGRQ